MSGFIFAFIAVLLSACGARDQALLGRLTVLQGRRPLLLIVALTAMLGTTALAAWAAMRIIPESTGSVRAMLGAIALILAGGEMVLIGLPRTPAEPTRSLFAAFLVLAAWQIGDPARLLVLALGVATAAPVPAALGGTLASGAMLTLGWLLPPLCDAPLVRRLRRAAGIVLILIVYSKLSPDPITHFAFNQDTDRPFWRIPSGTETGYVLQRENLSWVTTSRRP